MAVYTRYNFFVTIPNNVFSCDVVVDFFAKISFVVLKIKCAHDDSL